VVIERVVVVVVEREGRRERKVWVDRYRPRV